MANSRVPIEMAGVPGYQGDHTDYCMDIVKQVGSSRIKLSFDIFHVQPPDLPTLITYRGDGGYAVRVKVISKSIAGIST